MGNYRLRHTITLSIIGAACIITGSVYGWLAAPADHWLTGYESLVTIGLIGIGILLAICPWAHYGGQALLETLEKHGKIPDLRAFKIHSEIQLRWHRNRTTKADDHAQINHC